ncbi:hypothetical protein B0O99DRAFT_630326 [Bisporella sp. PMI_857]|nr:hypothetical protein B0O99DRAFT_630326 [Bisporella sp. PMI_857]
MGLEPETYYIEPTEYAPNNPMPVLVYRAVLPKPITEENASTFLEANNWEKRGTWGSIEIRHFHPNSHECYGIFRGTSTLLIGQGKLDARGGKRITVTAGDVIVLPAGTGHSSVESTEDYRYVGVYPKGCPRWRNMYGDRPVRELGLRAEIEAVEVPTHDPVSGVDGPLPRLWNGSRNAKVRAKL